jgi:hypothetical protein
VSDPIKEGKFGTESMSPMKGFFQSCAKRKRWVAAVLCVFAIAIIWAFTTREPSSVFVRVNIGIWTLLPPVLFILEYWAMKPMSKERMDVFVAEQQMAGRDWAAVLAVLLLTQTSLPLVGSGG